MLIKSSRWYLVMQVLTLRCCAGRDVSVVLHNTKKNDTARMNARKSGTIFIKVDTIYFFLPSIETPGLFTEILCCSDLVQLDFFWINVMFCIHLWNVVCSHLGILNQILFIISSFLHFCLLFYLILQ